MRAKMLEAVNDDGTAMAVPKPANAGGPEGRAVTASRACGEARELELAAGENPTASVLSGSC